MPNMTEYHRRRAADAARNQAAPRFADVLAEAIRAARQAMPFVDRTAVGFTEPHVRIPRPAVAGASLPLRALLPDGARIAADGRLTFAAPGENRPPGQVMPLSLADAAALSSRVLRAGSHLIEEKPSEAINTDTDAVALRRVPTGLRVVKPAPFASVPVDDPVGDTALAAIIAEAKIARPDDLRQYAFRVPLTRAELRDMADGELVDAVVQAVALGMGRAIDAELLGALAVAGLALYTPGAVAAKGLRWPELRAIVGTNCAAAVMADRGELFAAGIPADLTDAAADTIAAAFDRFGVVASGSVDLLVQRTAADGSVVLTCHMGLRAVVPDAGFAFEVA